MQVLCGTKQYICYIIWTLGVNLGTNMGQKQEKYGTNAGKIHFLYIRTLVHFQQLFKALKFNTIYLIFI